MWLLNQYQPTCLKVAPDTTRYIKSSVTRNAMNSYSSLAILVNCWGHLAGSCRLSRPMRDPQPRLCLVLLPDAVHDCLKSSIKMSVSITLTLVTDQSRGWSQGISNFYFGYLSIVSGGVNNFPRNEPTTTIFIACKQETTAPQITLSNRTPKHEKHKHRTRKS